MGREDFLLPSVFFLKAEASAFLTFCCERLYTKSLIAKKIKANGETPLFGRDHPPPLFPFTDVMWGKLDVQNESKVVVKNKKIKTPPLEQSYMEDPEEILECIGFHVEQQADRQFIEAEV